jgi:hypothetical protein
MKTNDKKVLIYGKKGVSGIMLGSGDGLSAPYKETWEAE